MHKVKICLASPSFFPTYGGAQLRFLRYLPGLQARGIDMYVLTGTPTLKEVSSEEADSLWQGCESSGQLLPVEEINGAKVNRICLPRHKTWRRWFTFNQKVVAYCGMPEYRPDVVQFVTNLRPRAIPWLLRLRRMRVPTIYAVTLAPDFSKYSAFKVWKFKLLFNLLSGIVTNSAAIRDMLHVTRRRFPNLRILLAPVRVQGEGGEVEIARAIPSSFPSWRPAIERALFQHYEPYAEAEEDVPKINDPAGVWPHVEARFVSVTPLSGEPVVEIGYEVAWDEEHTLGARLRDGQLLELSGSVLAP